VRFKWGELNKTGYNFDSASAVIPFLEKPKVGPTSTFCSGLAKRLRCYVTAGYPEFLESEEVQKCTSIDQVVIEESEWVGEEGAPIPQRRIVGANSAVLFGPLGQWIGGYRKTNLFITDKSWAAAGLCL
jgi:protein N-terminal amidase